MIDRQMADFYDMHLIEILDMQEFKPNDYRVLRDAYLGKVERDKARAIEDAHAKINSLLAKLSMEGAK